ncbi:hypothetical protein BST61_g7150 [Cercospora zeina]
MPVSKATKKFQKKHLSDTLEKRKGLKKTKQQQQLKERKKKRRAEEEGKDGESDGQPTANGNSQKATASAFKDMSVDDFFQGGFEIPELPKKKATKRKRDSDDGTADSGSATDQNAARVDSDGESDSESDVGDFKEQLDRSLMTWTTWN